MQNHQYFIIIPAQVRLDDRLSLLARLLYGDIAALAQNTGECWASNTYFSEVYKKDRTRIIAALKELQKFGYVQAQYKKPGNNGRVLIPCFENTTASSENTTGTRRENTTPPLRKHDGTRRENTTHNNINNIQKEHTCVCAFAQFWDAYPKKRDKARAEKAFQKLDPDEALLGQILAALSWQARSAEWTKSGGQFIPLAATYLNGRRWEDEQPESAETERPKFNFVD